MPSGDDIGRSITPGSIPYGEKQALQSNISGAVSKNSASAAGPQARKGRSGPQPLGNPMDKLLAGDYKSDLPVTSGLTKGPGRSPSQVSQEMLSPKMERYRQLALMGKNPMMRKLARDALRRAALNG